MIVDASALIAILRGEADAARFARALDAADRIGMSAASVLEAGIVADALGAESSRGFDDLIRILEIETIDFTGGHSEVARAAYQRYGRNSESKAKLNFGDCFAYATAHIADEPLLFKGHDFAHTDLRAAL